MVGEFIRKSKVVNNKFDCTYINLQTSRKLNDKGFGLLSKFFRFIALYFKVFTTLLNTRYDLCYITLNTKGAAFYKEIIVVFLLKFFNQNLIYHFHNKGVKPASENWINRTAYRYAFNNTQSILLSPLLYNDISEFVKESNVHYCLNGIPDTDGNLFSHKGNEHKCKILFLSNMIRQKGVYVLLGTLKILKDWQLEFECDFIGDWGDISEEEFTNQIKKLGLEGKINVHGPQYGDQKKTFLKNADIFVFPTLNDCLPLVLLEAMEFSLPFVSTREGAIPDILNDSVTGFIVSKNNTEALAEKLKKLILEPELRIKMGLAGRERYKQLFTLETFENRLTYVLEEASVRC